MIKYNIKTEDFQGRVELNPFPFVWRNGIVIRNRNFDIEKVEAGTCLKNGILYKVTVFYSWEDKNFYQVQYRPIEEEITIVVITESDERLHLFKKLAKKVTETKAA